MLLPYLHLHNFRYIYRSLLQSPESLTVFLAGAQNSMQYIESARETGLTC